MGDVNEIKKLSYISQAKGATRSDFKLFWDKFLNFSNIWKYKK